jgi:hypothetical protein
MKGNIYYYTNKSCHHLCRQYRQNLQEIHQAISVQLGEKLDILLQNGMA